MAAPPRVLVLGRGLRSARRPRPPAGRSPGAHPGRRRGWASKLAQDGGRGRAVGCSGVAHAARASTSLRARARILVCRLGPYSLRLRRRGESPTGVDPLRRRRGFAAARSVDLSRVGRADAALGWLARAGEERHGDWRHALRPPDPPPPRGWLAGRRRRRLRSRGAGPRLVPRRGPPPPPLTRRAHTVGTRSAHGRRAPQLARLRRIGRTLPACAWEMSF